VEARIRQAHWRLHAPHLLDVEAAQVLRRLLAAGSITSRRCDQALRNLRDLRIRRYAHTTLLPRVWALRVNLTAYDAAYVALAEALEAPLVTRDRRLADAPGHRADIEVV
jgi:predicted nucleic acid-binding protein